MNDQKVFDRKAVIEVKDSNTKRIGVYIHIPFCKSKCYYCDFNSYASKEYLIPEYCKALIKEIGYYRNRSNYEVISVFFGGGTPSLVHPIYICEIIDECFKTFYMSKDVEITIEANPGTLTLEKLKMYKKAGINRLSMGLQAWQDRLLLSLGRIHRAKDFVNNLNLAREAGFDNISADLIFGLPGQSLYEWEETLEKVTCERIEHLSCYSLKIEEGTVLEERIKKGKIQVIEDELDRDMYHMAVKKLKSKGFKHYEISNFSRPGFESRHNMIYWKGEEYIGLGAGAHSYFENKRYNNVEKPEDYVYNISRCQIPLENIQVITEEERISEYLILGLRLIDGISLEDFKRKFGKELLELYGDNIGILIKKGLLCFSEGRLKLTDLGLDLANQVFVEFI